MRRIVVELTDRCELHCRHCLVRHSKAGHDLDLRLFARLLSEARGAGFAYLSFSGGEPTLHPEFAQIVKLADEAGYRFGLVSSGWNFSAVLAQLERWRERLGVVTFSLDGSTEASHDWMRGQGSFRQVMRAISLCVVANLPFTLNTVITRRTRAELEEVAKLAAQLGSRGLRFGHLIPTPEAAFWHLDLPPEERKLVDIEIRDFATRSGIPIALAPGYYTRDLFPCAALRGEEITLDCRGHLAWCCQLPPGGQSTDIGSVGDSGLAELLKRLLYRQEQFRREKQARFACGSFPDSEFFPCWYCANRFHRLEWLKEVPQHPWWRLLEEARAAEASRKETRYAHSGKQGQGSSGGR